MFDFAWQVYLGAMSVGVALPLLWWSVSSPRDSGMGNRLQSGYSTDLREVVLAQSARERVVSPGVAGVGRFMRRRSPEGFIEQLEHKLDLAGMTGRMPVDRVLALKLLLAITGAALAALNYASDPGTMMVFAVLALAALGFWGPDLWLSSKAKGRQREIALALPDVLDQLTIGVEAGLGFEPALAQVGDHMAGPIGEEIRRTLQDIRFGQSRESSFRGMVDRTDVPELRRFVSSLVQADKLGIPLAQVLRAQAAEMRLIRKQRAEEEAQKLPLKMIFPLILCILPALIMVLIGPAILQAIDGFSI